MGHIFISYSHEDKSYARKLREKLRSRGFTVWIDEHNIPPISPFPREIENAICACAALVVIMTPAAAKSDWVEQELLVAKRENKPICPLLLQGDVFTLLINRQYIDVTNRKLPPDSFYEVLGSVDIESA